ncbi:MAG: DUF3667 domain-containing protein [Burkholderiaceae bacterium]|jgi:hypothetical protein
MTTHELPSACPNCEAPVAGPFCGACGQETIIETPTVTEFVHEVLHHYVAAEGKIWRTLFLLVIVPGQLTLEYLQGRRKRFIRPMQLYLTVSFVFFLLAGLTNDSFVHLADPTVAPSVNSAPVMNLAPELKDDLQKDPDAQEAVEKIKEGALTLQNRWAERVKATGGDSKVALRAVVDTTLHRVPAALFILMPLLAVILNFCYLGRRLPYGAHLLFSIHLHAFFFVLLMVALLPIPDDVAPFLTSVIPLVYLLLAIKRVYGGRWLPQILRALVIYAFYGGLVFTVLGLLFAASFFL